MRNRSEPSQVVRVSFDPGPIAVTRGKRLLLWISTGAKALEVSNEIRQAKRPKGWTNRAGAPGSPWDLGKARENFQKSAMRKWHR